MEIVGYAAAIITIIGAINTLPKVISKIKYWRDKRKYDKIPPIMIRENHSYNIYTDTLTTTISRFIGKK